MTRSISSSTLDPAPIRARVNDYIEGVLSGRITTGRLLRYAVQRHVDDLSGAKQRGWKFNDIAGAKACTFFENVLKHSTGQWVGSPFVLSPFQVFCTWVLFGWVSIETGLRRFKRAYITVARKNGKTTWCAGAGLYLLVADEEANAQIYVAATKEDQACIMLREAQSMCSKSPSLKNLIVNKKNIANTRLMSFFRPLGSDSKTNAGWNPHAILLDEVCDFQEHHRGLWDALTTASGVRRQPLQLTTCSAGDDESLIWEDEDKYAVRVLEQAHAGQHVDDTYFVLIARIDDEHICESCGGDGCERCDNGVVPADDPFDESVWPKANPNLGDTVRIDYLRDQANVAKNKPSARNAFIRFHANRRVASDVKAIDTQLWGRCGRELSDWSTATSVCGAFDLGRKSDLASIALVAKFFDGEKDGRDLFRYEIRQISFTHAAAPFNINQEPWSSFVSREELRVNAGEAIDLPGAFKDTLLEWDNTYRPQQWAYDPHNATYLGLELVNGYGLDCVEFIQTFSHYNEPMSEFLNCIRTKTIAHGNDMLLTYAASNLVINRNPKDEWMPAKAKSSGKVDPIVAAIMAFAISIKSSSGYWSPSSGVTL